MKTNPDYYATLRVAGDEACLWNWFGSVQAATHPRGDRTCKAHNSRWNVAFFFAVMSPLIGILPAVLALAIFRP